MSCSKTEMVTGLILDELSLEQQEEVKNHIDKCNCCHQEYQSLTQITKGLKEWSNSIEIPDSFEQRMEAALQAEIKPSKKRPLPYLAIACIMVLAVTVGLWEGYQSIIYQNTALEQSVNEESAEMDDTLQKKETADVAKIAEKGGSNGFKANGLPEGKAVEESQPGFAATTESIKREYKVDPNMVEVVEILNANEVVTNITDDNLILMLINGINTAEKVAVQDISKYNITHTISIKLNDGTIYKLNYNPDKKVAVFEGEVVSPGSGFFKALQQVENMN
ncbi:MAG: hypothetical protein FH758_04290 [Firmicutes bacterium]|nr:hypothetical protein [Bacillota bacterium]